jgi:hypothetical protein
MKPVPNRPSRDGIRSISVPRMSTTLLSQRQPMLEKVGDITRANGAAEYRVIPARKNRCRSSWRSATGARAASAQACSR